MSRDSWVVVGGHPGIANLIGTAHGLGGTVRAVVIGPPSLALRAATAGVDQVVWLGEPVDAPVEAYAKAAGEVVAAQPGVVFVGRRPAERVLAGASHVLFYVIMIGLPLTGWAAISSGGAAMRGDTATTLIGGVPLPFIPGLPRASHEWFEDGHGVLVKVTYVLLVLHVGGALKHQLFDKRGRAFVRMWPFGAR